jgi:hypothetical protein
MLRYINPRVHNPHNLRGDPSVRGIVHADGDGQVSVTRPAHQRSSHATGDPWTSLSLCPGGHLVFTDFLAGDYLRVKELAAMSEVWYFPNQA